MYHSRPRPALAPISPNRVTKQPSSSRLSPSVLSFPTKLKQLQQMEQLNDYNITQTSYATSSDSSVFDLALLDTGTLEDTFQKRMLQHERDKRRLRRAVDGNAVHVRPFSKARPNHRVAATLDQAERQGRVMAESDVDSNDGRPISRDGLWSTPHLSDSGPSTIPNVPRQWARKGRQKNDFLKRINSEGPLEEPRLKPQDCDPDVIYHRKTSCTGDSPQSDLERIDTAARALLPKAEPDSPPEPQSTRMKSRALRTSAARRSSLDSKVNPSYNDKFPRPRPDQENMQRQETEISGEDILGKKDSAQKNLAIKLSPSRTSLRDLSSSFRPSSRSRNSMHDQEEGEADLQEADVVAFKSEKTTSLSRHEAQAAISAVKTRPNHRRHGSRDLLRQLARASSTTPSPSSRHDGERDLVTVAKETSPLKQKRSTSMQQSNEVQNAPEDSLLMPDTPAPVPQTPIVAGAWLETPALTVEHSRATQPLLEASPAMPKSERSLPTQGRAPKSALEAVLRSHDLGTGDDGLGDSTVASLKDILEQDETADLMMDDETLDLIKNVNTRVDQGENVREEERVMVTRMNDLLKTARVGVRDVTRSLKRVELEVEKAEVRDLHGSGVCNQCGCPGGDVSLSGLLSTALRSLRESFFFRSGKSLHLTWLGLICLIGIFWFATEVTLCEYYCHPLYASSMRGYGVRANAPRMPYVTSTVLLENPLGWAVKFFWKSFYWFTKSLFREALRSAGVDSSIGAPESVDEFDEDIFLTPGIGGDDYI